MNQAVIIAATGYVAQRKTRAHPMAIAWPHIRLRMESRPINPAGMIGAMITKQNR